MNIETDTTATLSEEKMSNPIYLDRYVGLSKVSKALFTLDTTATTRTNSSFSKESIFFSLFLKKPLPKRFHL